MSLDGRHSLSKWPVETEGDLGSCGALALWPCAKPSLHSWMVADDNNGLSPEREPTVSLSELFFHMSIESGKLFEGSVSYSREGPQCVEEVGGNACLRLTFGLWTLDHTPVSRTYDHH